MKALAARFPERTLCVGSARSRWRSLRGDARSRTRCALLLALLALSAIGRAVSQPSLMSLASIAAPPAQRGAVMGAFQSAASLARVFGPFAAGWLYDRAAPAARSGSPPLSRPASRCWRARCRARAAAASAAGGARARDGMDLSFLPARERRPERASRRCCCVRGRALARRGEIAAHRRTMLTAFAVSTLFLALYVHPQGRRASFESTTFHAEGAAKVAYLALLFSHVVLAPTVPVLALTLIRLGLRGRIAQPPAARAGRLADLDVRLGHRRRDLPAALPRSTPRLRRACRFPQRCAARSANAFAVAKRLASRLVNRCCALRRRIRPSRPSCERQSPQSADGRVHRGPEPTMVAPSAGRDRNDRNRVRDRLGARGCSPSRAAAPADDARGATLFELCTQCHGDDGAGDPLALAPAIAGLDRVVRRARSSTSSATAARGDHPQDIAGLRMRPMSRTLKTDEDVQARRRATSRACRRCSPRRSSRAATRSAAPRSTPPAPRATAPTARATRR